MTAGTRGGVPDSDDLLDAVLECLREELLPGLSGRDRYQALVCVAALEIVRRESGQSEQLAAAEERFRRDTGTADDQALVAEIRTGAIDDARFGELVRALTDRNLADVAVSRG